MSKEKDWIEPKTWTEFRESGLLWWVNRTLHVFGWVIVWESQSEKAFPARCRFRGFDRSDEEEGYRRLTQHLAGTVKDLEEDCEL